MCLSKMAITLLLNRLYTDLSNRLKINGRSILRGGAKRSERLTTTGFRVMGHTLFLDLATGPRHFDFVVLLSYIMLGIVAKVFDATS